MSHTFAVLIVDDDPDIRAGLRELLEEEGYRVEEASDGNAAIQRLQSASEPFVVLLDWLMPRMSGGQFLQVAADTGLALRHELVLLTALGPFEIERLEFPKAVAVTLVYKPYDLDALLRVVADATDRLAVLSMLPFFMVGRPPDAGVFSCSARL